MITLEYCKEDSSIIQKEIDMLNERDILNISSKHINGNDYVLLMIQLTPATIATVSAIVIASIKSKRHITIKHDGYEITGLSEKNAVAILKKMMDEDKKNCTPDAIGKKKWK